jgi:hypothetical protein
MTLTNLTNLIGLKSTDETIATWFETHNLGKVPKSVNANQGEKYVKDKINNLEYKFNFDIINDKFSPPVGPKNDDYNFICYLSAIIYNDKKGFSIPEIFWDGYMKPNADFEDYLSFFEAVDNKDKNVIFLNKKLTEIACVKVWFNKKKNKPEAIQLEIIEECDIISHHSFSVNNQYNSTKPAYTLLVKWLFDNKYLILPSDVYDIQLSTTHNDILKFTGEHLKNHIWDNQITSEYCLRSFLYEIASNNDIEVSETEKVNVYLPFLYLKSAGIWEQYQNIRNSNDQDRFGKSDALAENTKLNDIQIQSFLHTLTQMFELFKKHFKPYSFD